MVCEYTNSKRKKYFLHQKSELLYFSKEPGESIDLPKGMEIVENEKTGLPMVKKSR